MKNWRKWNSFSPFYCESPNSPLWRSLLPPAMAAMTAVHPRRTLERSFWSAYCLCPMGYYDMFITEQTDDGILKPGIARYRLHHRRRHLPTNQQNFHSLVSYKSVWHLITVNGRLHILLFALIWNTTVFPHSVFEASKRQILNKDPPHENVLLSGWQYLASWNCVSFGQKRVVLGLGGQKHKPWHEESLKNNNLSIQKVVIDSPKMLPLVELSWDHNAEVSKMAAMLPLLQPVGLQSFKCQAAPILPDIVSSIFA